ncbi:ABC transporter permease [Aeromicrobium stalagmiti]|uniref:ABC transporter permease n=1 Tax=Aeromicrobium stalagmiti TaxID=2738988 RepID=UPI00156831FF|nr:ABC transporter permease subunit [Aeromicrobium stalagmiti]NRQ48251.1 ABC transporter permease subunit [Aeromicrobium stalagmiti]
MLSRERLGTVTIGVVGAVATIAIWWIAAATVLGNFQIPTPPEVLDVFGERGWDYYQRVFSITLKESGWGYLVGVGLALATAMVVLLVPIIEPVVMQFAVITYCLPIVVLAPILITVHEIPEKGGLSATAIDLAAVSVFFTTVVGAVLGFRAADTSTLDVVEVYGGSRLQQFRRVRLVSALPALFSTLQIAAPAAFLGALLGEYFDRHLEIGVGPSLILSQNNRETALAWSLGIGCAIVSGLAYLILGLIGRAVAPWSSGVAR